MTHHKETQMIGLSTINRKKIVFICSPYSGKTEAEQIRNVELARKYCSIACSLGFTPFAPHLLYPQFLDNSIREERDTGINCGLDILQLCSELWICGTKVTDGMKREIQFAKLCDIPVKEVQIDLDIM